MRVSRLLAGVLLAIPAALHANWFGTQFSAETYQTHPQQPQPQVGKMFVGQQGMRAELQQKGRSAIQIISPAQQSMWMLFPEDKTYIQQPLPGNPMTPDPNPCAGMQGVQCRQTGEETLNGRKAIKWEMSGQVNGQPVTGVQWMDSEHKFPVRSEQGGKVIFDLRYLGNETVNGRSTEKWESTMAGPQGQSAKALKWYDPKLNTAVREEVPGGVVRELRNIQEGPQPDSLFTVPDGYRKIDVPQGQPGQPGMPPRQ